MRCMRAAALGDTRGRAARRGSGRSRCGTRHGDGHSLAFLDLVEVALRERDVLLELLELVIRDIALDVRDDIASFDVFAVSTTSSVIVPFVRALEATSELATCAS